MFVKFADEACTHQQGGQPCDHRVEQQGRDGAAVLRSKVGLGVRAVVAEKALDVHAEGVSVLKIIGQHNGPGHDHQLEVKHDGEREEDMDVKNPSLLALLFLLPRAAQRC